MKNDWVGHPTMDYATFEAFQMIVFDHKCISEDYQDGEIWSDDEYWGSTLYDFDDDKYYNTSYYIQSEKDWEILITKRKQNNEDPSDGIISEDYTKYNQDAIDFYKDYLNSGSTLKLDEYYKKVYKNEKENIHKSTNKN